jgi:ribonuclease J
MASKTLRIIPLGGLGEVGKNMMCVEYGENILVIDAGIMFPENDMLGIDYIIPDFRYLLDKVHKVRGIVVTHGHEDHTGAIRHVLQEIEAPIYATPLTSGLLESKLSKFENKDRVQINTIHAGEESEIGPFRVEYFHVAHSIPDGVGLGITTPAGLIVHSGDYKFDQTPIDGWPTDYGKLAELGDRGVLALMADSTNADKPGWTPSETVIDAALDAVFREAKGRIFAASFASLVSRIAQVAMAAERHGRKMAIVGTSMVETVRIASELGYLDLSPGLVVPLKQALEMKPSRVVLMCTGTQGEPTSILGRLSTGRHSQLDIHEGDTVILSSHPIPGNEEMVHRTINRLFHRGAEVIYDAIAPVHVSGHASQEEIKFLLGLVKPKYLIPIHGELRHLKQHAALGRALGIPAEHALAVENGTVMEFRNQEMRIVDRIPGGYVFVDGSGVGDIGPRVLREREQLAREGFVAVHININPKTRKVSGEPELVSKGFIFTRDADELFAMARQRIHETIAQSGGKELEGQVERALSGLFHAETGRRPMIFVFLSYPC